MPASLFDLLSGVRPASHPVAFGPHGACDIARMRADVAHNAARIAATGARSGLLIAGDSYLFAVGLYALLTAGARAVLPPNLQPATRASFGASCDLVVGDDAAGATAFRIERGASDPGPLPPLERAGAALDFFTSGSTGEPKRIVKMLRQLDTECAMLEQVFGELLGGAPVHATVTHQHIYGLTFKILFSLAGGRPFAGPQQETWEGLFAALDRPSLIVTSPAHLTRLGGLDALPEALRPRLVLTGGAPLPFAAAQDAARVFGALPQELFGSTETGVVAGRRQETADPPWRPWPGIRVERREDGQLRVWTPFVEEEGWFDLADRVEVEEDGAFRLQGRADRIAKVEGKRVSLPEVEACALALPWIAAIAVAQPEASGRLGAVARLTQSGREELERLGKFRFEQMLRRSLRESLDQAAVPRRWRFVDTMPEDGMGKRRRTDVEALLRQQDAP
ncbi:MAG: acyl-CoA synthetase [Alphaproteobacteria bacterium]|nr:acyl-CoA synthetase [Alphaproteobacteria bacterium]